MSESQCIDGRRHEWDATGECPHCHDWLGLAVPPKKTVTFTGGFIPESDGMSQWMRHTLPRLCDRCGESEHKHIGAEQFCPLDSTFRERN